MHKVIVNGRELLARDGELLKDILQKNKNKTQHPCSGRGACRKCTVVVNGKKELSCQYVIKSDITVQTEGAEEILSQSMLSVTGEKTDNLCFALDLGSTTLAMALVSLDSKKAVEVKTCTNSQRSFGADVISRIEYCTKNGASILQKAVTDDVNSLIDSFRIEKDIPLFVSGNTTMLHIFAGENPRSMGTAPYTPVFLCEKTVRGTDLGLRGVSNVTLCPSISAFAGADLVAGINYIGLPENGKYNLLADLGTNAEIALFSEKIIYCTSAAAGPCFEGGDISQGMSASEGAVCEFSKDFSYKTIGNKKAKGICASALFDIMAVLLNNGIIDETGYMECERFPVAENVYITDADIRKLQLAKSAVYSAIKALLRKGNVSENDINGFYISGGFSGGINIENAVKIGLLPSCLKDKCIAIGNSSLAGTVKYALGQQDFKDIIKNAFYIDLAYDPDFSSDFVENMGFN